MKWTYAGLLLIVGVLALYVGASSLSRSATVTLVTDPALAPELRVWCDRHITRPDADASFSSVLEEFKKNIGSYVGCSRRLLGNGRACWKLETARPLVRLGNVVLTDRGTVVPECEFQEPYLERVPFVWTASLVPEEVALLYQFLQSVPRHMFERYTVRWHDRTMIELIDAREPRYTVLIWHKTNITHEFEEQLATLYRMLHERSSELPKRDGKRDSQRGFHDWILDMRPGASVIVYPKRECKDVVCKG